MALIEVNNLHKTYRLGKVDVPVLCGLSISVERGEWVAVLGASGSGKSTLLHLMGGLDRPDKRNPGKIIFDGRSVTDMSPRVLDRYRATNVGIVFQFYHLLPELTLLQNITIAAMVRHGRFGYRAKAGKIRERAESLLDSFGLSDRIKHRPGELSGGERQRVAIARALINEPDMLLADEPTGNLDRKTGGAILDSITSVRDRLNQTLIMVTHDEAVAARADRVVRLVDGRVAGSQVEESRGRKPQTAS